MRFIKKIFLFLSISLTARESNAEEINGNPRLGGEDYGNAFDFIKFLSKEIKKNLKKKLSEPKNLIGPNNTIRIVNLILGLILSIIFTKNCYIKKQTIPTAAKVLSVLLALPFSTIIYFLEIAILAIAAIPLLSFMTAGMINDSGDMSGLEHLKVALMILLIGATAEAGLIGITFYALPAAWSRTIKFISSSDVLLDLDIKKLILIIMEILKIKKPKVG